MNSLIAQYQALSRAGKWCVLAVVGLIAYFGVIEPTLDARSRWIQRADSIEATLNEWATGGGAISSDISAVNVGRKVFGEATFPAAEAPQSQALLQRIAAVMKAHNIKNYELRQRALLLAPGPLGNAPGMNARVKRIVQGITFECTQDTLADVLADLERSKEISNVSRVNVRKTAGTGGARGSSTKGLAVAIDVETWAIDKANAPAAGGES